MRFDELTLIGRSASGGAAPRSPTKVTSAASGRLLECWAVGPKVNSTRNDGPELLEPLMGVPT